MKYSVPVAAVAFLKVVVTYLLDFTLSKFASSTSILILVPDLRFV